MVITGVDGALGTTGLATFNTDLDTVIDLSKIQTAKRKATPTESDRFKVVFAEITLYLQTYKPDLVVAENQHVGRNKKTSLGLARVRGVVQLACALANIPFVTIEPSEIKMITTGKGNAKKEAVQEAIVEIYKTSSLVQKKLKKIIPTGKDKTDDMADALAIIHTYRQKPNIAITA